MVSRFREQLTAGASVDDAVRRTVHTAGRTVAFSAATVAAAMAALLVFPHYFLRSMGFTGVGVVAIAALSTLFVVPALLKVLGHRVNSGRLPWSKSQRSDAGPPLWGRLARTVMQRPVLTAAPGLAVLLFAASPLLNISFGTPDERVLPKDAESREVSQVLRENFGGSEDSALHTVIGQSVAEAPLASYAGQLATLKGVERVETSTGVYTAGQSTATGPANPALDRPDAQRISVVSGVTPKSAAAESLVKQVRSVTPPPGPVPWSGGMTRYSSTPRNPSPTNSPWPAP